MYEWKECGDEAHGNDPCGRCGDSIGMDLIGSAHHWHVVADGLVATPYHARCKPPSTAPEEVKALRAERKARRQARKQQGRERRTLINTEAALGDQTPRRRVQ